MYASQSIFTSDTFAVLMVLYIVTTIVNQVSMAWHRQRMKRLKDELRKEQTQLEKKQRKRDRYL